MATDSTAIFAYLRATKFDYCLSIHTFHPNKVLTGHVERICPCIPCNQGCITQLQQGKQPTYAVNPAAMREIRFALNPTVQQKKVAVIGGGVAGMEAARVAALRGHKVSLYEKRRQSDSRRFPSFQKKKYGN